MLATVTPPFCIKANRAVDPAFNLNLRATSRNSLSKAEQTKFKSQQAVTLRLKYIIPIFQLTIINLFAHPGFGACPGHRLQFVCQVFLAELGCLVASVAVEHGIESVDPEPLEVLSNSKLYTRVSHYVVTYPVFLDGHKGPFSLACCVVRSGRLAVVYVWRP